VSTFKIKGKFWLIFTLVLGLISLVTLKNLDADYSWKTVNHEKVYTSKYYLFSKEISENQYDSMMDKLDPLAAGFLLISSLLFSLNVLIFLYQRYGQRALKFGNNISTKISAVNEEKVMDRMLKLKQLYDSELISKEEYDAKLAKLKNSVV
jgi:hypothetical protein